MHHLSKSLAACMAVAGSALSQSLGIGQSVSIESVSGCPAVVSTTDVCNTCVTPACVVPATITAGCDGCGETPPTIYRSFPCEGGCEGLGGCQTIYTIATATDNCPTRPTGSTGDAGPTPAPSQTGSDASTGGDAPVTSESTAGAARMMPFRLW